MLLLELLLLELLLLELLLLGLLLLETDHEERELPRRSVRLGARAAQPSTHVPYFHRIRPYFQKGHYGPYSTYSRIFVAFLPALRAAMHHHNTTATS